MSIRTLVVDDDFRVARLHAEIIAQVGGFAPPLSCSTVAQARKLAGDVELALVDVYLPDGSGLELVRALDCDVFVVTAAAEPAVVRTAIARGALAYLIKPFPRQRLVDRLQGYRRYRGLVERTGLLTQSDVDTALRSLLLASSNGRPKGHSAITEQAVADAVRAADVPVSALEVADRIGISRATAQRYLSQLVDTGRLEVQLRYGSTGRPEHRFLVPH